jgi:hypothetical protein
MVVSGLLSTGLGAVNELVSGPSKGGGAAKAYASSGPGNAKGAGPRGTKKARREVLPDWPKARAKARMTMMK